METKRKYTQLKSIDHKNKLVQVKLTSKDYDSVVKLATETGHASISSFIRDLIQQEIAKSL